MNSFEVLDKFHKSVSIMKNRELSIYMVKLTQSYKDAMSTYK